jgi:hypothetical protein
MAIEMLPVLVGGVAVGYVALKNGPAPVPTNVGASGGTLVGTGGAPGQTLGTSVQTGGKVPVGRAPIRVMATQGGRMGPTFGVRNTAPPSPISLVSGGGGNWKNNADAQVQQVLNTAESYGEAAYDNLDDAAKQKGADILNKQLKIDPPLKGDESWKEMGAKVGAYAGSEGANAACEAGGIPPICGPLGDKLGAYLGADLGEWLHAHDDDVKNWFRARWSDIDNWVMGLVGDVEGKAQEYYDDVKNFVGGLF